MNAGSIIADWERRLIALAENPEYVFRDAPRHLIEQHYRRLTTFVGYPEPEVAEAEALAPESVVLLFHQGYTFVYLLAIGGFDSPTMQWTETQQEPQQMPATFAEMVDDELLRLWRIGQPKGDVLTCVDAEN
jgi:hypothetical protein